MATRNVGIPQLLVVLDMPDMLLNSARFVRVYNQAVKESAKEVLEEYWREVTPKHFEATARTRYGYKQRDPLYKMIKNKTGHGRTDLVFRNRTKTRMVHRKWKISASGQADNRTLVARMTTRFPFPVTFDSTKHPNAVQMKDMAAEIVRTTPDEEARLSQKLRDKTAARINQALANSPRLRKRLGEAAAAAAG